MISESYHGAYLFVDCDNPSIFSAITKNHIIIFVCYKPYRVFLILIWSLDCARYWQRHLQFHLENTPWVIVFVSWIWIVWSESYVFNFKPIIVPCEGEILVDSKIFHLIFFEIFQKFSPENEIRTSPCQVGLGRAYALWFRVLQVMVCRGRSSHLYWQGDSVHGVWHFEPGSSKSQISSDRIPTAKSWNKNLQKDSDSDVGDIVMLVTLWR